MENLFLRLFAADEDYWKKVSHQHLRTKLVSLLDRFEDDDQTSYLIKYENRYHIQHQPKDLQKDKDKAEIVSGVFDDQSID